jgi:hypothetical protein
MPWLVLIRGRGIYGLSRGRRFARWFGDDLLLCLYESINNVPVVYPAGWMPVGSDSRRSNTEAVLGVLALYDPLETGSATSTLSNDTTARHSGSVNETSVAIPVSGTFP